MHLLISTTPLEVKSPNRFTSCGFCSTMAEESSCK